MSVTEQRSLDSNSIWAVLTGPGNSDPFHLAAHTAIAASVVTAVSGTTPSLQVFLDVQDPAGNWVQQVALTAQTGAGVQSSAFVSNVVGASGRVARFRWTLTGTNPTATVLLTAAGR
jgi:hypothetical protein